MVSYVCCECVSLLDPEVYHVFCIGSQLVFGLDNGGCTMVLHMLYLGFKGHCLIQLPQKVEM